ncbi:MAG TPA: hypothetical protein DC009_04315 [Porphyromonadaceae bacterium]|nr:hypothetical protein [Porphyromonadaceae bacterium]
MALINCPQCGHTISDKAKQCPKCGHIIAHNTSVPQDNTQDNTPTSNKTNAAVLAVLIICILALGMILFGIVIPATNGNKSAVIDTDSVWDTAAVYCVPAEEDSDSIQTAEEVRNYEPTPQESAENMYAGTYTVTDKLNNTWIFKLNADKTATIQKKGSDGIVYADWNDLYDNTICISCDDKRPRIVFPNLDEMRGYTKIRDGYLYVDYSAADSKNPERRLKITKTN